jgi:hypothetical protein
MTGDDLKRAAIELYGESGWVSALATNLKIHRTQVWRYVNGRGQIPGPVEAAVTCWLQRLREERQR